MKRLNWERANRRERYWDGERLPVLRQEIKADPVFWESWRQNKAEMKRLGYSVRKLNDGWHVYLESK